MTQWMSGAFILVAGCEVVSQQSSGRRQSRKNGLFALPITQPEKIGLQINGWRQPEPQLVISDESCFFFSAVA